MDLTEALFFTNWKSWMLFTKNIILQSPRVIMENGSERHIFFLAFQIHRTKYVPLVPVQLWLLILSRLTNWKVKLGTQVINLSCSCYGKLSEIHYRCVLTRRWWVSVKLNESYSLIVSLNVAIYYCIEHTLDYWPPVHAWTMLLRNMGWRFPHLHH